MTARASLNNERHNALPIHSEKNQKALENSKEIATVWNGRKIVVVVALGVSSVLALTAGIVAAVFASYLVAVAVASLGIVLLLSAILVGRIKVAQDLSKNQPPQYSADPHSPKSEIDTLIDIAALPSKKRTVNPSDDLKYQGCNAEEIGEGEIFQLPRTLYHLFFVYFSLHNYFTLLSQNRHQFLPDPILLGDFEKNLNLSSITENEQKQIRDIEISLHRDIRTYFANQEIADPQNCTWQQVTKLVNQLFNDCENFDEAFTTFKPIGERRYDAEVKLAAHFCRFVFSKDKKDLAKKIILNALAEEWTLPKETVILYRCGNLWKDHVQKQLENQKKTMA